MPVRPETRLFLAMRALFPFPVADDVLVDITLKIKDVLASVEMSYLVGILEAADRRLHKEEEAP